MKINPMLEAFKERDREYLEQIYIAAKNGETKKVRDAICTYLYRGMQSARTKVKSVKDTDFYKLADMIINYDISTYQEAYDLLKQSYGIHNPSLVLHNAGRFEWDSKIPFPKPYGRKDRGQVESVPDSTATRKPPFAVKGTKHDRGKQMSLEGLEVLKDIQCRLSALEHFLGNTMKQYQEKLQEDVDILKKHVHIIVGGKTSKPVEVKTLFEESV